ncbi:MAG TPA: M28 family peptidase [Bryobacteraceae bacterium]|nr:M28 family peptidase [Bryobacteraceae bacterium]
MTIRKAFSGAVLATLAAAALFAATSGVPDFDPSRYLAHIKYLASPEMKGRETGSPELEKAAQYIANQFRADGLQPLGGKSYLQPFEVTTAAKMGKTNRLEFVSRQKVESLNVNDQFIPFNFSAKGKATGGLVFAGYGITAPEYNYDDYSGIDVHGKFVVVMAHEPQEFNEKSVFDGKVYTDHAQMYSKAANARKHGALGVLLINDRVNHTGTADDLEAFGRTTGPADAGILFVQVKEAVIESLVRDAGRDLMKLEKSIDTDLKPVSFVLPDVEVRENIDVERAVRTVHNVIGYMPGETDEYLIIGAHYDHLGLGAQFSLAPSLIGTVHPGADDNASGTAGVIELARHFTAMAQAGTKFKRGIVFMTFAGEELGLLGSSFYANHPELPLAKAVTMINMDMIGRVHDGKLYVGGAGTGSTLRADLDELTPHFPTLHVDYSDTSGYGSSDHTEFTAKQVPVLFFFSGLHSDYHKPSDTWDKIDAPDAVTVLRLVMEVAERIDGDAARPVYVRVEPPKEDNPHAGSGDVSGGGGYGPYFGSIPDFGEIPNGVKFADITPGSPAALGGLKAGDILTKFGSDQIKNLYDFTYALRAHKPGDEVEVQVLRDGRPITTHVKLTERK